MTLNMLRLQRIIASERVDLVQRALALGGLGGGQGLPQGEASLVTSLPADGGGARPRTCFEIAVVEGDIVIAPSEFAARRAESLFARSPCGCGSSGPESTFPGFSPNG